MLQLNYLLQAYIQIFKSNIAYSMHLQDILDLFVTVWGGFDMTQETNDIHSKGWQ